MMFCLKGYSREEVALLLNAADVAFLTSKWEGSPQFIKEAEGLLLQLFLLM